MLNGRFAPEAAAGEGPHMQDRRASLIDFARLLPIESRQPMRRFERDVVKTAHLSARIVR
jgi:hypothetical protein